MNWFSEWFGKEEEVVKEPLCEVGVKLQSCLDILFQEGSLQIRGVDVKYICTPITSIYPCKLSLVVEDVQTSLVNPILVWHCDSDSEGFEVDVLWYNKKCKQILLNFFHHLEAQYIEKKALEEEQRLKVIKQMEDVLKV